MKKFAVLFLIFILIPRISYAWKSALPSTHHAVTEKAIKNIKESAEGSQYPDITRYFDRQIANWSSGLLDDKNAHGRISEDPNISQNLKDKALDYNGGPFEDWKTAMIERYQRMEFIQVPGESFFGDKSAYYYVGLMAHLIEDQCVPAHPANISHGGVPGDDMELWFWGKEATTVFTNQIIFFGKDPNIYYYDSKESKSSILTVQKKLKDWKYPMKGVIVKNRGVEYWKENASAKYTGQAFFPQQEKDWGLYGGEKINPFTKAVESEDIYTSEEPQAGTSEPKIVIEEPGIALGQLDMAVSYVAGLLQAISRSLPALVRDLHVDNPVMGLNGLKVSFRAMENRTQKVTYTARIYDTQGALKATPVRDRVEFLNAGADLPWEKDLEFTVQGKTDLGAELSDGEYTLALELKDDDGNSMPSASQPAGTGLQPPEEVDRDNLQENNTRVKFRISHQPQITHELVRQAEAGRDMVVLSTITAFNASVSKAEVWWRYVKNGGAWNKVAMGILTLPSPLQGEEKNNGRPFRGVIPGGALSAESGLEYFVYAVDSEGRSVTNPEGLNPERVVQTGQRVTVFSQSTDKIVLGDSSSGNDKLTVQFYLPQDMEFANELKFELYEANHDFAEVKSVLCTADCTRSSAEGAQIFQTPSRVIRDITQGRTSAGKYEVTLDRTQELTASNYVYFVRERDWSGEEIQSVIMKRHLPIGRNAAGLALSVQRGAAQDTVNLSASGSSRGYNAVSVFPNNNLYSAVGQSGIGPNYTVSVPKNGGVVRPPDGRLYSEPCEGCGGVSAAPNLGGGLTQAEDLRLPSSELNNGVVGAGLQPALEGANITYSAAIYSPFGSHDLLIGFSDVSRANPNNAPEIVSFILKEEQTSGQAIYVSAQITDLKKDGKQPGGIEWAKIFYRKAGEAAYQETLMKLDPGSESGMTIGGGFSVASSGESGGGVYSSAIPSQAANTEIQYYVSARDNEGNESTENIL